MYKFLKYCYTVFHSSCIILHSHQQSRVPIFLHPHQHLLFSFLLKKRAILKGMKCYLIVVLIRVSLMISDTIFSYGLDFLNLITNIRGDSLVAQMVKRLLTMWETQVQSLGWEDPLEKEMATHSRTLAWKIPWTEELGRLQSMGSKSWTWLSNFTSLI